MYRRCIPEKYLRYSHCISSVWNEYQNSEFLKFMIIVRKKYDYPLLLESSCPFPGERGWGEAIKINNPMKQNMRAFHRKHCFYINYSITDNSICEGNIADRYTFCVAALKSDSAASKILGINFCGLRSMIGNQLL